jgi:2-polyprenyl-3-methyl-5-hydroxy-6-metoxy-1,4-benzoquinol methylase
MTRALLAACFLLTFPPPFSDWLSLIALCLLLILMSSSFLHKKCNLKAIFGVTTLSFLLNIYLQAQFTFSYQTQLFLPEKSNHDDLPSNVLDAFTESFLYKYPQKNWCNRNSGGCWRSQNRRSRKFQPESASARELEITSIREIGTPLLFAGALSKSGDTNFYGDHGNKQNISRNETPFLFSVGINRKLRNATFCSETSFFVDEEQISEGCYPINEFKKNATIYLLHLDEGQKFSIKPSMPVMLTIKSQIALKILFLLLVLTMVNYRSLARSPEIAGFSPLFIILIFYLANGYAYQHPLFRGGDDGLVHSSFGNNILNYLFSFDFKSAFLGGERVFYYMPGLRYFWPAFIVLFGYTTFPFILLLSIIPLLSYQLALSLKLKYPFLIFIIAFIHIFSFERFAVNGFPEVLSYPLYIGGLALYFRFLDYKNASHDRYLFSSFVLLTLSVFIRPNLVLSVFFLAVVSLPLILSGYKRAWVFLGCFPVFFTLIHNFYYSGELVLFTSSALIEANLLCSPRCYLQGTLDLMSGKSSSMTDQMLTQLRTIFFPLTKSILLLAFIFRLLSYHHLSRNNLIFGGAVLMVFVTQIFWHSYGRYIWMTQLLMLMFISNDLVKVFFTSNKGENFPLKKTIELIKKLKRLNPNLRGVNALKFFYRPFIFPLYPMLENVKPDAHILDIGCGSGFFLCAVNIETKATKLHGLEIDPKLVSLAQNNLKALNLQAKVELFDGLNCNQDVAKADLIFLNDVYHHVPVPLRKEFLHNIASSMKPGARLVFKDINGSSLIWKLFNKLHDFIFSGEMGSEISLKEARELISNQGLKIDEQYCARHAIYNHFLITCIKG